MGDEEHEGELTIGSPSPGMREALAMSDEEVRAATLPPYADVDDPLDLADDLKEAGQRIADLERALRTIAECDCGHASLARLALAAVVPTQTSDEVLTHNDARWWQQHVGRRVVFTYDHGEAAFGRVSSVNDSYVFVRFGTAKVGQACEPSKLTLESGV